MNYRKKTIFTLIGITFTGVMSAMSPENTKKLTQALTVNNTQAITAFAQQYELKTMLEAPNQTSNTQLRQVDKNKLLFQAIDKADAEQFNAAIELGADINCVYTCKPTAMSIVDAIDFGEINDWRTDGKLNLAIEWVSPLSFARAKKNARVIELCILNGARTADHAQEISPYPNIGYFDAIFAGLFAKKQMTMDPVETDTNKIHKHLTDIIQGYLQDDINFETVKHNHASPYSKIAKLPGNKIAAGTQDGNIHIIDAHNRTSFTLPTHHQDNINYLIAAPCNTLVSASVDGHVCIWNLAHPTQKLIREITRYEESGSSISSISVLADYRLLIKAYAEDSSDLYIDIWDHENNSFLQINIESNLLDHLELPGNKLAVASENDGLLIFDIARSNENELTEDDAIMQFHNGDQIEKLAINGNNLLCFSLGMVHQYDISNLTPTSVPARSWPLFADTNHYSYFSQTEGVQTEINEAPEDNEIDTCVTLPDGRYAVGTADNILIIDLQDPTRIIVLEDFHIISRSDNTMVPFKNNTIAVMRNNTIYTINLADLTHTSTTFGPQEHTIHDDLINLIPLENNTFASYDEQTINIWNTTDEAIATIYNDRENLPAPVATMTSSTQSSSSSSSSTTSNARQSKKRKLDSCSKEEKTDSDDEADTKEPATKKQKTKE